MEDDDGARKARAGYRRQQVPLVGVQLQVALVRLPAEAVHGPGQIAALAAAPGEHHDGGVGVGAATVLDRLGVLALGHLVDGPVPGDAAVAQVGPVAPAGMLALLIEFAQFAVDLQPGALQGLQENRVLGVGQLLLGHPDLGRLPEHADLGALGQRQGVVVIAQQHNALRRDLEGAGPFQIHDFVRREGLPAADGAEEAAEGLIPG